VRNDLGVLLATTVLSYPIGLALGQPWLLPLLNALPAYVVLVHRLRKGERGGAVRAMLWWAAALALTGTLAFALWPQPVGPSVVTGPEYQQEMFRWIRTGSGRESSPRLFLPQHLLQLAAFVVIGLASASAGAILMGALLMNRMSFYVASLAHAGMPGWGVVLLGWSPWSVSRVAAFATLGVLLAEPLLVRLSRQARERLKARGRGAWVMAAMSGILADWFLKALLAPAWGHWLRGLLP
jgi:hypothetical protein